jgi:hypothetical protein
MREDEWLEMLDRRIDFMRYGQWGPMTMDGCILYKSFAPVTFFSNGCI